MGHVHASCCTHEDRCKQSCVEVIEAKAAWSPEVGKSVRFTIDDEDISTDEGESALGYSSDSISFFDKDGVGRYDRKQTFSLLNASSNSELLTDDEESDCGESDGQREEDEVVNQMLAQIANLVDRQYDVLPAEELFAKLEKIVAAEKWKEIQCSPLFERFCRKLDFFYNIGSELCQHQYDWLEIFSAEEGRQAIHISIDKEDSRIIRYQSRIQVPTALENVMGIATEVTLMKKWNGLVADDPEVVGRRTAHYMVTHYQMSALAGFYKADVLNEVRRFSDPNGGFVCEYSSSPLPDHPSYREPKKGFKRIITETRAIHLACGRDQTISISVGRMKLPFSAQKLPLKRIGSLVGGSLVGGLIKNALRVKEKGSPWIKLIEQDEYGLYKRVEECMNSPGSMSRVGCGDKAIKDFDLEELFSQRRFYKDDSRTPKVRKEICSLPKRL